MQYKLHHPYVNIRHRKLYFLDLKFEILFAITVLFCNFQGCGTAALKNDLKVSNRFNAVLLPQLSLSVTFYFHYIHVCDWNSDIKNNNKETINLSKNLLPGKITSNYLIMKDWPLVKWYVWSGSVNLVIVHMVKAIWLFLPENDVKQNQ